MEVYEDQDYDIEEIKFWNFMSRNKNIKPTIIRTVVYKVPESEYTVKKCQINISKKIDKNKENEPSISIEQESR